MPTNEFDIIRKIRSSKNPELAMQIVMRITLDYLTQLEAAQTELVVHPQETSEAT